MKVNKGILISFFFTFLAFQSEGQKQLVLLKNERVLLRLKPGDELVYKLKGSKAIRISYINNLSDTYVLAHRDTVPFNKIDKIYFRQEKFYNKLGAALVVGGAALFLIDQVNIIIVNGQSPSLDSWVSSVSATSVAVGLPMMLIKKKSQKINYKYRLLTVKKGSPFYRHDPREPISPFLETD